MEKPTGKLIPMLSPPACYICVHASPPENLDEDTNRLLTRTV